MMENRITELEIKLAYQEDLLQALDKVVTDQQMQISRLEKLCHVLNERVKNLAESEAVGQTIEIPPHY